MAKELPYFKFFPGKWLTGDITLQDEDLQGIFINVCAVYWSKKCSIAIDRLRQRYGDAIDSLLSLELIKLEGSTVRISFLDEQWIELNGEHDKNVENGKKGAEKRWKKNGPPVAFRKEKKRKEYITPVLNIEFENIKEVVKYLNQKAGKNFSENTATTQRLINARLKTYSVADAKKVIDIKVSKWGNDPKMKDYLTPSTLFAESNFEKYLNEAPATQQANSSLTAII